jgi:anaerobic ribonucleoside-triphosphate reductase
MVMKALIDEIVQYGFSEESAREILEMCDMPVPMKEKKTVVPTEIYSRVVGYFRPVQQWNNGKREEFRERKPFNLNGSGRYI